MNKIMSKIKDLLPLALLVLGFILFFVPLPVMLIQVLLVLDTAFSLCLFLSRFFNSTAIAYYFPRLVIYNSIYTCGIAIATTRTFLSIENLNEHIPLVLTIGRWICRENYVCGFFTTLLFCIAILGFCHHHLQKFLDISASLLEGAMAAVSVLFVVAVAGGATVGILDMNLFWKDALNQYIMLASGYLVLFVAPLFLTALSFKVCNYLKH